MPADGLSQVLITYRYWILIPLSIVEGPIVAFVTGSLASLGYFNPYLAFGIFLVKDGVVDGAYYSLGRFAGDKPFVTRLLTKARVTQADRARMRVLWDRHGWRTMGIGKLAWGLSPAFLVSAGFVAVPVWLFFQYAIGAAVLQYAILLGVGYYFGHAIGTVSRTLRILQVVIAGAALAGIVYARRRLRE